MSKFAKKFLIWQAICSCGKRSDIFVTNSSINQEVYKKECLQKRLLPLLRQHTVQPLFWPDLATCHYANNVLAWHTEHGVHFVPKHMNPPNCPELRPIEAYWAMVKRALLKSKGVAKDVPDMTKQWKKAQKTVAETTVQCLMDGVKRKVRALGFGVEVQ